MKGCDEANDRSAPQRRNPRTQRSSAIGQAASSPRPTARRGSWLQLHHSLPIDGCPYSVAPPRWDRRSGPARGRRLKLNVCEVKGPQDRLGLLAADPRIGATACQDGEGYPTATRTTHRAGAEHVTESAQTARTPAPSTIACWPTSVVLYLPAVCRARSAVEAASPLPLLVGGGMIRGHLGNAARPTLLSWYTPRCVQPNQPYTLRGKKIRRSSVTTTRRSRGRPGRPVACQRTLAPAVYTRSLSVAATHRPEIDRRLECSLSSRARRRRSARCTRGSRLRPLLVAGTAIVSHAVV